MTQDPNAADLKLKPCPFCGSEPIEDGKADDLRIRCEECGHMGLRFEFDADDDLSIELAQKKAAQAWNRRALNGEVSEPTNPNSSNSSNSSEDGKKNPELKGTMEDLIDRLQARIKDLEWKVKDQESQIAFWSSDEAESDEIKELREKVRALERPTLPEPARDEAIRRAYVLLEALSNNYGCTTRKDCLGCRGWDAANNLKEHFYREIEPDARSAPKGTDLPAPGIREVLHLIRNDAAAITRRTLGDVLMLANRIVDGADTLAALHPQPRPMTWTKEKPTAKGYYWRRIISTETNKPRSMASLVGMATINLDNALSDAYYWEWAGPIPEPQEPRAEEGGSNG